MGNRSISIGRIERRMRRRIGRLMPGGCNWSHFSHSRDCCPRLIERDPAVFHHPTKTAFLPFGDSACFLSAFGIPCTFCTQNLFLVNTNALAASPQNSLGSPASASMVRVPSLMVRTALSASPFCLGVCGLVVWFCVDRSSRLERRPLCLSDVACLASELLVSRWRIDRRTFLFYCSISCTCYTSCISEDSIASAAPIAPCHSSTIANILCSFGMLRDRKQVACDLWDMKIVLDDDCISRC